MKYAIFDDQGLMTQCYAPDIHGDLMLPVYGEASDPTKNDPTPVAPIVGKVRNQAIPAGVVELSDAQWLDIISNPGLRRWNGSNIVAYAPPPAPPLVPDGPTLGDWRVGLTLWGRLDDVTARVEALAASSHPADVTLAKIAKQRLEYSNSVRRAELMQLAPAMGFTEADVDESLWRAAQVAQGDLSGVWPLQGS